METVKKAGNKSGSNVLGVSSSKEKPTSVFEKMKKKTENADILNVKTLLNNMDEKCSNISPLKSHSPLLKKQRSKTHEMSDSESESDLSDEARLNQHKPDVKLKTFRNKLTPSPSPSKRTVHSISKPLMKTKSSENHDISDSESDEDNKRNSKCDSKANHSTDSSRKSPSSLQANIKPNDNARRLDKSSAAGRSSDHEGLKLNTRSDLSLSVEKTKSNRTPDCGLTTGKSLVLTGSGEGSSSYESASGSTSKSEESSTGDSRPLCKYGSECYRNSQTHQNEFRHTGKRKSDAIEGPVVKRFRKENGSMKKSVCDVVNENQPYSFFLTKVTGIDHKYNEIAALNIKDILSPSMGNLKESCQFNFMIDIDWLMKQYPKEFRNLPLLIVHGQQRSELATFLSIASSYPNITCCQAKLEMYGTHHSKMMFLLYDNGMRVVIHTANLDEGDWYQKTQGIWISPLFPKLESGGTSTGAGIIGDSPTHFKEDLLEYLASYRSPKMKVWEKHIQSHDMSSAKVYIIGSVPGRHTGAKKNSFGHLKLRKVLQENGPDAASVKNWPVIGQFSSIGSLGPTKDNWLCKEWLQSLSATRGLSGPTAESNLFLVFPSVNNVRLSLEGYVAGGSVPYHFKTAKKQLYLHQFFRQWRSEGRGRSCACPHIKTYIRPSPDFTEAAWFLVTSANLSKAAWGAFEKNCSQVMIRSYEIGVLFLPKYFGQLKLTTDAAAAISSPEPLFPLPYDLPLSRYDKGDRPWMVDLPCVDLPDTHGEMWCPPVDDL